MKSFTSIVIAVFFSLSVIAQVPSYVPLNNLKAWWSFSGDSQDLSGNEYHGIINSATLTTDRNNIGDAAYYFNNASMIFKNTSNLNFTSFSISFWIHPNSSVNPNEIIKKSEQSIAPRLWQGMEIKLEDSTIHFNMGYSRWPGLLLNFRTKIDPSIWNHLVYTINENLGESMVYLNGNLQETISRPIYFVNTAAQIKLGSNNFSGKIDDVGVWKAALSSAEVLQLFSSPLGFSKHREENISIYPNPASQLLTIELTEGKEENILLFNAMGRAVEVNSKSLGGRIVMDVSSLKPGTYWLHISSGNKRVIEKLLIKR